MGMGPRRGDKFLIGEMASLIFSEKRIRGAGLEKFINLCNAQLDKRFTGTVLVEIQQNAAQIENDILNRDQWDLSDLWDLWNMRFYFFWLNNHESSSGSANAESQLL